MLLQIYTNVRRYFIDKDWRYHEVLLAFEHVKGQHTGQHLATVILRELENCRISGHRILTVTSDNARNNGTMVEALQDALSVVHTEITLAKLTHVPCLAHVIQLALNSLIDAVKITAKNKKIIDEWNDDDPNPNAHSTGRAGDGAPYTLLKVTKRIWFDVTVQVTVSSFEPS